MRIASLHTALLFSATCLLAFFQSPAADPPRTFATHLAALERQHGGRLGVAALDTGTLKRLEYRAAERFALCSTFKLPMVAAVLARVDAHQESLGRRIAFSAKDLVEYAPIVKAHMQEGALSLEALCIAVLEESDNAAANLLLRTMGGPQGLTATLRAWGDTVTRLDRMEPELNSNLPGDARDTTSPAAMLGILQRLFSAPTLSPISRAFLEQHLIASKMGSRRLRAGLPPSWRVGNKSGTGDHGATNDIAILWPPQRSPIFVTTYYSESAAPMADREGVLAEVGRLIAAEMQPQLSRISTD